MNVVKLLKRRSAKGITALAAVALAAGVTSAASSGGRSTATAGPVYGGTVVVACGDSWTTLDPATTNTSEGPFEHVFETLFSYHLVNQATGQHKLSGLLAQSWSTPTPKVLIIKLRKGIKFSDGSDWNANVAKWNLDRIRHTSVDVASVSMTSIVSVKVVNNYTIRLNLNKPDPALLITLSQAATVGTGMISEKAFQKGGSDISKFVGTGPFIVKSFQVDNQTTVVRNPHYWRKDARGNRLPYLNGITFRVLLDVAVESTELQAGTVNLATNVPATELQTLRKDPSIVYLPDAGAQLMPGYIGFNTRQGAFANVNVRQAAMRAINRSVIAKAVGYEGVPTEAPYFGPATLGWEKSMNNVWPYDPAAARKLLNGAHPSGTITFQAREPDQTIATIIQQMWAQVGINVTLLPADSATWAANMMKGDFDVSLWSAFVPPDPALALPAFACGGSYNWSQYCNKGLASLYAAGDTTFNNARRVAIYQKALQIIAQEAPFGPVFSQLRNIVTTSNLKGVGRNWYYYDLTEAWLAK